MLSMNDFLVDVNVFMFFLFFFVKTRAFNWVGITLYIELKTRI